MAPGRGVSKSGDRKHNPMGEKTGVPVSHDRGEPFAVPSPIDGDDDGKINELHGQVGNLLTQSSGALDVSRNLFNASSQTTQPCLVIGGHCGFPRTGTAPASLP